jgi:hypothetical protein
MMSKQLQAVLQFNKRFGLDKLQPEQPGFIADDELQADRLNFMLEELIEYGHAVGFLFIGSKFKRDQRLERDMVKAIDGLIDLEYVLNGTHTFHGFHRYTTVSYTDGKTINEYEGRICEHAFVMVHEANMMKERKNPDNYTGKRNGRFDISKPEGWESPSKNLAKLLRRAGAL